MTLFPVRMFGFVRFLALGFICASLVAAGLPAAAQSAGRKAYVSVTDREGVPIKDMTAADFEVKEGGKVVEITSVQQATIPLRVALLVADGGTGAYQQGVITFIERMPRTAEFKLVSVAEQPETLVEYTSNTAALTAGVQRLGRRSARRTSGQLMEAIVEASKDVAAEGKRPVILVMRLGGEAPTNVRATAARDELRKAGARLYVISPTGGGGTGAGGMGVSRNQADQGMAEAVVLNQVINDGAKDSGGRHDQVAPATLVKTVQQVADELLAQYEISYNLPAGAKPSDRLQVETKRSNVRVYAPSRIPN